jgi:hypothetical protein
MFVHHLLNFSFALANIISWMEMNLIMPMRSNICFQEVQLRQLRLATNSETNICLLSVKIIIHQVVIRRVAYVSASFIKLLFCFCQGHSLTAELELSQAVEEAFATDSNKLRAKYVCYNKLLSCFSFMCAAIESRKCCYQGTSWNNFESPLSPAGNKLRAMYVCYL